MSIPNLFNENKILKTINFEDNRLNSISTEFFEGLPLKAKLKLQNNWCYSGEIIKSGTNEDLIKLNTCFLMFDLEVSQKEFKDQFDIIQMNEDSLKSIRSKLEGVEDNKVVSRSMTGGSLFIVLIVFIIAITLLTSAKKPTITVTSVSVKPKVNLNGKTRLAIEDSAGHSKQKALQYNGQERKAIKQYSEKYRAGPSKQKALK